MRRVRGIEQPTARVGRSGSSHRAVPENVRHGVLLGLEGWPRRSSYRCNPWFSPDGLRRGEVSRSRVTRRSSITTRTEWCMEVWPPRFSTPRQDARSTLSCRAGVGYAPLDLHVTYMRPITTHGPLYLWHGDVARTQSGGRNCRGFGSGSAWPVPLSVLT